MVLNNHLLAMLQLAVERKTQVRRELSSSKQVMKIEKHD